MSTDRQLKKLFEPFLKAHPEARYHNGRIFVRPVSQVAWALALRTSRSPNSFSVTWGPAAMFIPDAPVWPLHFSVFPEGGTNLTNEGIAEKLLRATEEQCLAHLPEEPTITDLYRIAEEGRNPARPNFYDTHPAFGSLYHAAQGHFDRAIELSSKLVAVSDQGSLEKFYLSSRVVIRDLHPLLLAGNRKGIGALLRHLEQRCVASHKMEKFWEPAPYPVELQA